MKRLVVCCDGTWNDVDEDVTPTNVVRMARAVKTADTRNGTPVPQVVYYQSGVGTGGGRVMRLVGGGLGIGLSRNVREAYAFLANNYDDGDEIFLFGFSRGAYTARSVAGLVGWAGLLAKADMDEFFDLWEGYRLREQPGREDVRDKFPARRPRVRAIGVWDTVGALGIPGNMDKAFAEFFEFHNTMLGTHVDYAFQALALDERRKQFEPAVWERDPVASKEQVLVQTWFPGAHSNVGGGYPEHGMSDITLAWMAGQVDPLLDLDDEYLAKRQDRSSGWGLGKIHNSSEGLLWKALGTPLRRPFAKAQEGKETREFVHQSLAERLVENAECIPKPYRCEALGQGLKPERFAPLTPLETKLKWAVGQNNEVAPRATLARMPEPSLTARVLRAVGGT